MKLFLDLENGRLAGANKTLFRPEDRSWQPHEGEMPSAREVSPVEAVVWLQKTSGSPCRVPVAVIGGREATPAQLEAAERMGRRLGQMGLTLVCGGRQGIMEAACRGAAGEGGLSIGILPDADPAMANPHVSVPIATGIGIAEEDLLAAMQTAGSAIAFQMGLGFAVSADPTQGQQGALVGTFLSLLALTLIFATDLHHLFIMALVTSYEIFEPGQVLPTGDLLEVVIDVVSGMFAISVQVAAPFLVFGLVFYLGLGLLSRLMPQIQIFFIAMPANIMVGFIMLAGVLAAIMTWYLAHIEQAIRPFLGLG